MRTITPPAGPKFYRITCTNDDCAAVMECSKQDLRYVSDQRDGDAYVMKCPHCAKETWVDSRILDRRADPSSFYER